MATQQEKAAAAEQEKADKAAAEQNKEQLKAAEDKAKEAAPEGADPADYTGFSPAATDKIAAKSVDMERALPHADAGVQDLSAPKDGEPAYKED